MRLWGLSAQPCEEACAACGAVECPKTGPALQKGEVGHEEQAAPRASRRFRKRSASRGAPLIDVLRGARRPTRSFSTLRETGLRREPSARGTINGELKDEACPSPFFTFDEYRSPMFLDYTVNHGKPETHAPVMAFRRKERIENMGNDFFRNADPIIGHLKTDPRCGPAPGCSQGKFASIRHGINGIENEVQKTLLYLALISHHPGQMPIQFRSCTYSLR